MALVFEFLVRDCVFLLLLVLPIVLLQFQYTMYGSLYNDRSFKNK